MWEERQKEENKRRERELSKKRKEGRKKVNWVRI